jgi:2-oxo-hept-3-ene-1,7-dioate hydratase
MLDSETIKEAARRLDQAEKSRTQIGHFSMENPEMTIEDAYAVQRAWMAIKLAEGRVRKGQKIGLTSKVMQVAVNIDEPDYGMLLDDMFYEDGAQVPFERFIEPRVEVEVAFILGKRLSGPDCTVYDVLNATDFVVPAIEILDARVRRVDPETGITRKIVDTISDNAGNGALVLGGRPFRPVDVDLRWIAAIFSRNGEVEDTGVAAAVLNNPANGIAWLANKLAPHGECLEAGEVVLSGSFTRATFAHQGDTFNVDYGPLGSIACRFV